MIRLNSNSPDAAWRSVLAELMEIWHWLECWRIGAEQGELLIDACDWTYNLSSLIMRLRYGRVIYSGWYR